MTPNMHVESAAHSLHGVLPEAEKVVPAIHGPKLHTVSVVAVQAVLTPAVHVASAIHVLHGVFPEASPEAENVSAAHYTYEEK